MKGLLKQHRADGMFHSHVAMGDFKGKFALNRQGFEDLWLIYGDGRNPSTIGLAEKQQNYAPFLVDVDLAHTTEKTLYSQADVQQLVQLCQNTLYEKVEGLTQEMLLGLYLSKEPYYDTQKEKWKHGIHLHFPYVFLDINSLKRITNHISTLIQETNIFSLFPNKDSLIDDRVHNVPWLLYGSAKEGKSPYLFNTAYDFKLKSISLEQAFKNYIIYNGKEKPIDIKGKVQEYLPRILSVIAHNRKVFELKSNAFPKPKKATESKAPIFKISEQENSESDTSRKEYEEIDPEDEKTEIIVKQLMCLIGDYHADDYMDWLKCGWILHHIFKGNDVGLEIWKEFSSKIEDKYDETDCECRWEKIVTDGRVGIGTLKFWAKLDSPELYSLNTIELPNEVKYNECKNIEVNGFESVSYIDLLNQYDTVFVKGNMGCGKTEKIKSIVPLYNKIVFVSSKRSLAYDFHNKYPEFELYDDLKGTIDIDIHNKVIIQVDSLNRLIGKVDLFIIDEFVDLSSQLLSSRNRTESIDAFQVHLQFSSKRLIMDANLNRIDFFSELLDLEKAIFVKDNKIYHNDKHVIEHNNKDQFTLDILTINNGRMFIPSDSKKFIDTTSQLYMKKYPERKVLVLTSESSYEDRREDWDNYDVIFCSPTITAGVSHKTKIDHVYGYYTKRSINAWSATQQLLRCRNWVQANIYFGSSSDSKDNLPVNDSELEKWITDRFNTEITDIEGLKINRIKKTIDKTFIYYMYLENLKRTYRSKKFFRYYFLQIMKEHGVKSTVSKKQIDESKLESIQTQKKVIEYESKEALIKAITTAQPTDEDMRNFKAHKFDHINKAVLEVIFMTETYGFCPRTEEGVWTYMGKRKIYKNICKTVQDIDTPTELSSSNYSNLDIKDQNDIQRRTICNMILKTAGFNGLLDKNTITINEKLSEFVRENLEKIQVVFNSHKKVTLEDDKALMKFVNSKLEEVYEVKMTGKQKMIKGKRNRVYNIEGMEIWSEEQGKGKPCITNKLQSVLRD